MKSTTLNKLLNGVNCKFYGEAKIKINSLFFDSRKVVKNGLFFCLNGTKTNGVNYCKQAIKNGAVAIVTTQKLKLNITQIIVKDTRIAMALISANFYDNPQQKLKIIGITGTNGKTSTSYIIAHILKNQNKKVGVIGTSGIFIDGKKYNAKLTTPDSIELFSLFKKMKQKNIEYVVMEVSAHSIYYNKVYGINFAVKVLTNVKTDHLDFFITQSAYENTKKQFFTTGNVIVNGDDKIGIEIAKNKKTINYGLNENNCFFASNIKLSANSTIFTLNYKNKKFLIKTNLIGRFNIYNILCAISTCFLLGFTAEKCKNAVKDIKKLDGRLDSVNYGQDCNIIIDYAHTTDSLKNLLITIKEISNNKNIIVFGCPGERDSFKRREMGYLAGLYCNTIIITSDNPASENALRIMQEIEQGVIFAGKTPLLIENRKRAIKKAMELADNKSNVLIVGKGNEKYQVVGNKKIPHCDYDVVKKLVNKLKK